MAKKELEDKIRSLVKQTLTDKFVKKIDDVL